MLVYLLVFLLCLIAGITYVYIIWRILKRTVNRNVPSPFNIGNDFLHEIKKFGTIYLIGDMGKFVIELFIFGLGNTIILRIVAILITFSTSGFFGRLRNLIINKIKQDSKKHIIFWEFLGDTFASLIFWIPMYVIQILMFIVFGLTNRTNFWHGTFIAIIAILIFGRIGCYGADLIDKRLFYKKN